jgi:response regulator NasT
MKPVARIVIVSPSEDSRSKLARLLTSSGLQVFRSCSSGSELRRALSESEDCVVVMVGFMADCKPDELIWDYKDSIQILLMAKQPVLDNIDAPEVFRLALPASGQAVIGAVEMLSQLHRMRLPRRSGESKDIVDRAKALLMRQKGLSEPEAHRAMQQYAMNHGMKMADFARRILEQSEES